MLRLSQDVCCAVQLAGQDSGSEGIVGGQC